jgi:hypothetical protein
MVFLKIVLRAGIALFNNVSVSFAVNNFYFQTITRVPVIIITAPRAVLRDKCSPRKITDNTIVRATLNLSTGATWDTLPIWIALK